jgi:membrane-bound lytic murein transglycosylase F
LRHYYPEARVAFELGAPSQIAWALPKGANGLREAVASYFAEIQSTGQLKEILNRDEHNAHEFDFVGSRAFVRHLQTRFHSFEEYFKRAAAETDLDWRLIAAIAYQESHWDPNAVSPTGVRGIMMLTEHSAKIVKIGDRNDAWESILGGARYLRRVHDKFPTRIPEADRILFAAAAYNIGFGHVEDARIITEIQGGDPDSWAQVRERLPLLADESWYSRVRRGYAPGTVPVKYVDNVSRYRALIGWMEGTEMLSTVIQTIPSNDDASI